MARRVFGLTVTAFALGGAVTCAGGIAGCGTPNGQVCVEVYEVAPQTATADHRAAAPGNQQPFNVGHFAQGANCVDNNVLAGPQSYVWVSSDPVNAPISNAKDATAGVATCVGATTARISTTTVPRAAPAILTCK